MKNKRLSLFVAAGCLLLTSTVSHAQRAADEEVSPRIQRFEAWLDALSRHRPGLLDDSVRLVSSWNQEQLRLIWMDALTIVSLIREPGVSLFYVSEAVSVGYNVRQLSPVQTRGSQQVLYASGELQRLREVVKKVSPKGRPGPENDMLKRGAMLHADIEILLPRRQDVAASDVRPGPGGVTLFMNDGQQTGLANTVSHWNMGRRLLERVRPLDSKNGFKTRPDPGADDVVRRWYVTGGAYMMRMRLIEIGHFSRALELFPEDPEVLFLGAAAHDYFAGVRTQAVMRALKAPREVSSSFGVMEEGAELRLAEQLYKRVLEREPTLHEARIRLGRVVGLRGRHKEAVEQLRLGLATSEPLLTFYVHLFLGSEFEALGNGTEARQSYERAAALQPTAQSPLLGLSRLAEQAGDRAAAQRLVAQLIKLPSNEERTDPWWVYEIVPARALDALVTDLRQRVAALPQ